jgi:hypothetical protein
MSSPVCEGFSIAPNSKENSSPFNAGGAPFGAVLNSGTGKKAISTISLSASFSVPLHGYYAITVPTPLNAQKFFQKPL